MLRHLANWLRGAMRTPTVHALYHESRDAYHSVYCADGVVLVCFSDRALARHFARAARLRAYLPAPITAESLLRDVEELARHGIVGFTVDPSISDRHAGVYALRPRTIATFTAALRDALRHAQRRLHVDLRRAGDALPHGAARAELRLRRSAVLRGHLRLDEAEAIVGDAEGYDEALRAAALYELGCIAFLRRDLSGAAETLEQAIATVPQYAGATSIHPYALLGAVLRMRSDRAGATAAYREAYRLEPGRAALGLALLSLLQDADEDAEVESLFESLCVRHLHHPGVLIEYADWLTERKRYNEAVEVRRRIARAFPDDTSNLIALALLCDLTDELEEGFTHFARAIARTADRGLIAQFHQFCVSQGLRALKGGHARDAVRCFKTVTRKRTDCPNIHLALALALDASGAAPEEVARVRRLAESRGARPVTSVFDLSEEALIAELLGMPLPLASDDRFLYGGGADRDEDGDPTFDLGLGEDYDPLGDAGEDFHFPFDDE